MQNLTVRLCADPVSRLAIGETLLLPPLSICEDEAHIALPALSKDAQTRALAVIREMVTSLATENNNSDWWYLPVAEVQPSMSVLLDAVELQFRLQALAERVRCGTFVLTVQNARVARYLFKCGLGFRVIARRHDRTKWAVDRFKDRYRRYVNAALWAIEHVQRVNVFKPMPPLPKVVDTLFITRLEAELEEPDDTLLRQPWCDRYLGELIEEGRRRGPCVVLGRCGGNAERLARLAARYDRFVLRTLYQVLGMNDVFKAIFRALRLRLRVPVEDGLFQLVRDESRNHVRAVADCLLVEKAVLNVSARCAVKRIVCMQENSVWEHAVVRAGRKHIPRVPLIGYFHCPVMPSAIRYHWWPEVPGRPIFDRVVPLGDAMARALERLGSWWPFLTPGYGFRNPDIRGCLNAVHHDAAEPYRIVVLLGGMFDNAVFLKWVDHARQGLPAHRLLIKGHPVYGSSQVLKSAKLDVGKVGGIEDISHLSLLEALQLADCVVYKGTTVGISALAAGVPAIHVDHGGLQSDDALFDSGGLSASVATPASLREAIKCAMDKTSDERAAWRRDAQAYARNYYELSEERRNAVLASIFEDTTFAAKRPVGGEP